MIWDNSSYLWLLLLLPLLYGGYWFLRVQQVKKRKEFFDDRLISLLRQNYWTVGDRIRHISFLISAFFLIVALSGPKIGTEVREIQRTGVNMMVVLDLSKSMNAEDIRPSRLEKSKFEINRLINRLQGDRLGLLVYTGEAFVQSPMTLDHSALRMFLDIVNTDQMPSGSTNFKAALDKAYESFQSLPDDNSNAASVVLLFSDGEDHSEGYQSSLSQLVNSGVSIFTVGVGTEQGGTIPVYDQDGNLRNFVKDRQGNTITTRLEQSTLREIAQQGGGSYYEIRSGSDTIEPFFSMLEDMERGEFSSQEFADFKNQYQILLAIGLFFFLAGILVPDRLKNRSANDSQNVQKAA